MRNDGFYHIAGLGSYSEREGPPFPWTIDVNLSERAEELLTHGQRLRWKVMPKAGRANRATAWSDFAATNLSTIIVSDRAKEFLEAHASGDLQFIHLPVKSKSGRHPLRTSFWVANCLHLLDCVNERQSPTDVVCGDIVYKWVVIARSKVPKAVKVFRCLAQPDRLLVRGSLGNAIRTAGLTGAKFFASGRPGDEDVW